MASKQSLQSLQESAQHHIDQARALQNSIKKLNSLKKDADIAQQQEALVKQLKGLSEDLNEFDHKVKQTCVELDSAPKSSDKEKEEPPNVPQKKETEAIPIKKRQPEDQENLYQVKARLMPQIYAKNKNLEAELVLMNRRNELRAQRKSTQVNYNRETNLSAVTTLRAIQLYERKAKEAEARAIALQTELDELKAQQGTSGSRQQSKSAEPDRSQSFLGKNNRVNDVIRKNEVLQEENQEQQREIQRLKRENAELIKKTKAAQQDWNHMMAQLNTSDMVKKDLQTRLHRQKSEYDRLSRSLTRQSTDWIEARKSQTQMEEEWRWRNVGHAAPHGAYERTFSHAVPMNVHQPRNMYPVEKYAQSGTA